MVISIKMINGFVAFALIFMAASCQTTPLMMSEGEDAALQAQVDEVFERFGAETPGAAVAVIKDGEVVYQKGYGMASLEYGVPIGADTVFHVASVSKQFTSLAIVMLAAEGKLSLDDDIRKYLPEVSDMGEEITIRHLIYHTSGLRDQWVLLRMAGWRMDDVISTEHILKLVERQKELNFKPGEEHLYCNTGYTLLAEIVARVSGQSFREWTAENIFEPLGMTNTHFHDDHEMVVLNRAYSYRPVRDGKFKKAVLSFANVGATSLFTTAEDLAKWLLNFEEKKVGGAAVLEQMREQGVLNNGEQINYAFALSVGRYKGLQTVGHSGSDAGFRSYAMRFPEQRFGVVVLSNVSNSNPSSLARQVVDIYLADEIVEPEESNQRRARERGEDTKKDFAGKYQHDDFLISITREGEQLMWQASRQGKFELNPAGERAFVIREIQGRVIFEVDAEGTVTGLRLNQVSQDIVAEKVERFTLNNAQLAEFAGEYFSEELDTIYRLVVEEEELVVRHQRHSDFGLRLNDVDEFRGGVLGTVRFGRDEEKRINGFRATSGRVRNLRFEKIN